MSGATRPTRPDLCGFIGEEHVKHGRAQRKVSCVRKKHDWIGERVVVSLEKSHGAWCHATDTASSMVSLERERGDDDAMFTLERHLPTTPGQPGHSPQRHTAACRPHHHRHGEHSPTACVRRACIEEGDGVC